MTKATQAQFFDYFSRELWENNDLELDENILVHLPADAIQEPFGENMIEVKFSDGSRAHIERDTANGPGISFIIV